MCGRIASNISGAEQLIARFLLRNLSFSIEPRYNIAPTQLVTTVVQNEAGERTAVQQRWGLIPGWAKDATIGNKMINARCETVAEKPAFRNALRKRRCVIPVTGFYEWQKSENKRIPYHFQLCGGELMALAGLWEEWRSPQAELVQSFTIITTTANDLVQPCHNRMPVVLGSDAVELWLDHANYDYNLLLALMQPYPPEHMEAYEVSAYVNSPAHEGPECIAPIAS